MKNVTSCAMPSSNTTLRVNIPTTMVAAQIATPVGTASGRTVRAGLFETMELLGRERSLLRARKAAEEMERLPKPVG